MRGWRVVRRQEPLTWESFLLFFAAFAFSLCISGFLLSLQGKAGFDGMLLLLEGGFGHGYSLEDTILKAIPIFLCASGVAVCFRMQVWNIGAEGQYVAGAVGATWFVITFPDAPAWGMMPGMAVCAIAAGGFWATIPAVLRLWVKMNEIISSLMLNYIAIIILRQLVYGPWKDPNGVGFPHTFVFPDAAIAMPVMGRIHWGLVLCLLVGLSLSFFFKRTRLGFEVTVGGENARAARYAGMPYGYLIVFVFAVCGALAGVAGGLETSVTLNRLSMSISVGYGYTAIVVAWLAKLRVSRIAFFAFLLAGLRVGVENLQIEFGVPAAFAGMIEGLILLTVLAAQFFDIYTLKSRPAETHPPEPRSGQAEGSGAKIRDN